MVYNVFMDKYEIRPHHLLCMKFFEGKGYCDEFTDNMNSILDKVEEDPYTRIFITYGSDDICSACPNDNKPSCILNRKANDYDMKVSDICSLDKNVPYSYSYLRDITEKLILREGRLGEICSDCEWYESICKHRS